MSEKDDTTRGADEAEAAHKGFCHIILDNIHGNFCIINWFSASTDLGGKISGARHKTYEDIMFK